MVRGVSTNKALFFSIIVSLFLVSFVNAGQITQTVNFQEGYQLFFTPYEVLKQNQDFELIVNVINLSNGLPVPNTDVSCANHLYDTNGTHIWEGNLTPSGSGSEHSIILLGGNFSELGTFSFRIICSNHLGGSVQGTYNVTPDGNLYQFKDGWIVFSLMLLTAVFLAVGKFFEKEHWILKTFFYFASVGAAIIAINTARIISSQSINLNAMGATGLTLGIVVFGLFFLYMFVYAFIEIINVFKEKKGVRWNY